MIYIINSTKKGQVISTQICVQFMDNPKSWVKVGFKILLKNVTKQLVLSIFYKILS